VLPYAMTWKWAPPTRCTLRRNTASIMKGLVFVLVTKQNRIIYLHQHKQFSNNKLTHLALKQKEQYVICVMKR